MTSMTDPFGFDTPFGASAPAPAAPAAAPAAEAPAAPAPASQPEPTPAPVEEPKVDAPTMTGGNITVAIQIPNCTYFHTDVTFPLEDVDKVAAWVETTGAKLALDLESALTRAGLVKPRQTQAAAPAAPVLPAAGATGQAHIPAPAPAQYGFAGGAPAPAPVVAGTGAAAIGALATGAAAPMNDGFSRVTNNYGKLVVFPSTEAYPDDRLSGEALGFLQSQYGLNPAVFHIYHNRRSAEQGQPLRGTSVSRIVLNKDYAPHFPTVKAAAWIAWKDGWKVDLTDELKDVLLNNPQGAAMLKVGA